MKIFGLEFKFNGFDIFHTGNFNPDDKVDKGAKITLPAGTTTGASLNIPHGAAPTTPVNGDMWTTTSAPLMQINGTTRTIYHSGNAGTAALSTVTQAEAEAGTATTVRAWTAQRVRQAIIKVLPTKLSQFENDIGAGGGIKITTSTTEPSGTSPGDFWYKEV